MPPRPSGGGAQLPGVCRTGNHTARGPGWCGAGLLSPPGPGSWWSPSGLRILSGRSACAYFRGVLSPPQVCAQLPISQTNQGGWGRCHLRLVWKRSRGDGLSQRYSTNLPEEVARLRLAGTGSRGMLHRPAGRLAPSPPCKHEENQQLPRRAGPGVWATHFRNCRCGLVVKNPPVKTRDTGDTGSIPGLGQSLEKEMTTPPAFLPGESHGQRSLVDCRQRSCKESDTTE